MLSDHEEYSVKLSLIPRPSLSPVHTVGSKPEGVWELGYVKV